MKKTLYIFAAAVVAALFSMTGCENESVSEHAMSVDPSYSKMGSSGSLTLTAHGGWNYHWSISEGSIGSLSKTTGNSVVYTAHGEGTQKITVSSNTSSTNSATLNATATIIQGSGSKSSSASE